MNSVPGKRVNAGDSFSFTEKCYVGAAAVDEPCKAACLAGR